MAEIKEHNGRFSYKDIHWQSIDLDVPCCGYTRVHLMPYRITAADLQQVSAGKCTRTDTTSDIDKHGTGNIHPSRNDVAAASLAQTVQQLVLVSDNNPAGHFGPAVPKGFTADGSIYHLHKADVPAANFFPLIEPIAAPTAEEIRKQQLLRLIAADLNLDNLLSPSGR